MSSSPVQIFPAELAVGDELWRDQARHWSRVAEIGSGDHELLVVTGNGSFLHLPCTQQVCALHPTEVAENPGGTGEAGETESMDERLAGWYAGDLESAKAAHVAHAEVDASRSTRPVARSASTVGLARHLLSWYAGDLEYVIENAAELAGATSA